MKISECIKFLRIERGFSQKEVLPRGVPISTYSKFEHDKQSLKAEHIFQILDNLQITYEEFTLLLNRETDASILKNSILSCVHNINDYETHKKLLDIYQSLKNKPTLAQYEFSALLNIKEFFASTITEIEPITTDDLKRIKELILTRNYLGFRDYQLLSNHIMNFSDSDVDIFIRTIFPIDNFHQKSPETRSIIFQFFINLLTKELYANNLNRACHFLRLVKELHIRNENYYFGLQILYFESMINYLLTGESENLSKINETLKIISYMGDTEAVQLMQQETKHFLKDQRTAIDIGTYPMLVIKDQ